MLGVLVKRHITNKARICNLICPANIEELLENETRTFADAKKRIVFSWLWDGGGKGPNASATIPGIILVNAEWAARIVLYPDDKVMHDAFKLTMGHEFTHQENDYFFVEPFTKNEKFVYWVNEIHADFGGVQKAFEGNVEQGIVAMEYKKNSKLKEDKDSFMHPSWERRMQFLRRGRFDESLVREIARLVGCKNEQLISKVSKHYEEIVLSVGDHVNRWVVK